jgi:hypothetical protein
MWYDISLLDLYLELIFYKYMIEYTGELVKPPIDHGRKRSSLCFRFVTGAFLLRMLLLSLLFVCMYLSSSTTTNYHPKTNVIISERVDCLLCWSPLQSCWDRSLPLLFLVNVRRAGTCMFRSNFINHKGWKYCSSD